MSTRHRLDGEFNDDSISLTSRMSHSKLAHIRVEQFQLIHDPEVADG